MRQMVLEMVKHKLGTYVDCLQRMARRLAVLQLVPYTSSQFDAGGLIDKKESEILPSARYALNAARFLAQQGNKRIIVSRGNKYWKVTGERVVTHHGGQTRGGYFSREAKDVLLSAWNLKAAG